MRREQRHPLAWCWCRRGASRMGPNEFDGSADHERGAEALQVCSATESRLDEDPNETAE